MRGALLTVLLAGGCTSNNLGMTDGGAGKERGVATEAGTRDVGGQADQLFKGCGLRTCATAKATCGPVGDGCGGLREQHRSILVALERRLHVEAVSRTRETRV